MEDKKPTKESNVFSRKITFDLGFNSALDEIFDFLLSDNLNISNLDYIKLKEKIKEMRK